MSVPGSYLVGLDNGGTANTITVMDRDGHFLEILRALPGRYKDFLQHGLCVNAVGHRDHDDCHQTLSKPSDFHVLNLPHSVVH